MYNIYGGFGGVQVIGYKNLELLREHLSSCSLRRLKSEVLDLPERNFSIEYVELLPQQRALYDEVAAGIAAELDLLPNKRMTIIEEITMNLRLRQITA
jgi:SNF2 family DNA or RNA helicase